jgi:hypothetical protein
VVCDPEGEWSVRGEVVLIDGQAACRRITVYRNEMPGVTSTLLRQVPLGRVLTDCRAAFAIYERDSRELVEEARQASRDRNRKPWDLEKPGVAERLGLWAESRDQELERLKLPRKHPRKRGYGDDHYRRIAFAYLDLQESGVSRGLIDKLARRQNKPRETMRDWVHEARQRKFLTKTTQGRGGAQPGPRLLAEPPSKEDA